MEAGCAEEQTLDEALFFHQIPLQPTWLRLSWMSYALLGIGRWKDLCAAACFTALHVMNFKALLKVNFV